jgi:hypothetical protein
MLTVAACTAAVFPKKGILEGEARAKARRIKSAYLLNLFIMYPPWIITKNLQINYRLTI